MGLRNSSKTRVAPVFFQLLERDATGATWLRPLLELPERPDGTRVEIPADVGTLGHCAWWPDEKKLRPPPELLEYLLEHLPDNALAGDGEPAMRRRLLEGDAEALAEARAALDAEHGEKDWFIFEGVTHVDAYLETERVIAVIEGKRTERKPTTSTKWMRVRHQMLRSMDAVWDLFAGRHVFGFFIVEELTTDWIKGVEDTVSEDALYKSLPHRPPALREQIAHAFLGATTWDKVCDATGIDYESLPNVTDQAHEFAIQREWGDESSEWLARAKRKRTASGI